jgi:hypothetical protein
MFEYKKVGGIRFFRIGQLGFSVYITRKHPPLLGDLVLGAFCAACWVWGCFLLADILDKML